MKPPKILWITNWLIIILIGLSACTSATTGEKQLKHTLPGTLMDGAEGEQPPIPGDEQTGDTQCTDTDPHPIGQSIAETYDVSYQQVMGWFCSGYSFENILIALETSQAVDIPPETLLQMLLEKEWEQIWAETGFTDTP